MFFVVSCFVGNCPSTIQENEKKLSLEMLEPWQARACSGTTVPDLTKPNGQNPVAWHGRARPLHTYLQFFFHLLPSFFNINISHLSNYSLKTP